MAPHDEFPKLKLDTKTTAKPTSLPAHSQLDDVRDALHNEQFGGGSEHSATPPIPIEARSGTPSRQGTPATALRDDFLDAAPALDDSQVASFLPVSEQVRRARVPSISFHPQVTSDSGDHLPLHGAESEGATPRAREGSGSPVGGDEALYIRNQSRDRRGDVIAPRSDMVRKILLGTDNGFAKDSEFLDPDKVASLTSATTSPSLDEVRTPLEPVSEYFMSPTAATASPIDFPASQGNSASGAFPNRNASQRNRSLRSERVSSSLRKASRRSSTRSNGTSPASAFLGQWGRSNAAEDASMPAPSEPDAEGMEIGDHSEYIIGVPVGHGGFSVVKEVHTFEDGVKVTRAVKIVRKSIVGKSEAENDRLQSEFEREVGVWRYLKHPYILPLLAVYDTPFATFCIMKLNYGGTLFDLVKANRERARLNTTDSTTSLSSGRSDAGDPGDGTQKGMAAHLAKRYIYQLASALRYLHEDVRVVHRDVKLENCLVDMSGPNAATEGGDILLCDFGLADFVTNESRASPEPFDPDESGDSYFPSMSVSTTIAGGSLNYAAPELINARCQTYSTAVDMWAFGVVAYAVIVGGLPFSNAFAPKVVEAIQKGKYDLEAIKTTPAGQDALDDVLDLIKGCLELDAGMRWTIAEVLESRWLDGCKEMFEEVQTDWT